MAQLIQSTRPAGWARATAGGAERPVADRSSQLVPLQSLLWPSILLVCRPGLPNCRSVGYAPLAQSWPRFSPGCWGFRRSVAVSANRAHLPLGAAAEPRPACRPVCSALAPFGRQIPAGMFMAAVVCSLHSCCTVVASEGFAETSGGRGSRGFFSPGGHARQFVGDSHSGGRCLPVPDLPAMIFPSSTASNRPAWQVRNAVLELSVVFLLLLDDPGRKCPILRMSTTNRGASLLCPSSCRSVPEGVRDMFQRRATERSCRKPQGGERLAPAGGNRNSGPLPTLTRPLKLAQRQTMRFLSKLIATSFDIDPKALSPCKLL
jgi:hypothetical protein